MSDVPSSPETLAMKNVNDIPASKSLISIYKPSSTSDSATVNNDEVRSDDTNVIKSVAAPSETEDSTTLTG